MARPLTEQRQGMRKLDLVIEFGKANHITAAATAVAVEQAFVRIHHEAWLAIDVQRAQSHPPAAIELPCWPPILCLEIVHQRNLLLQFIKRLASHGLLASN